MNANHLHTIFAAAETANLVLPNFADPLTETDKTYITDFSGVSNDDFLSAIFGSVPEDAIQRPLVVSITGDPSGKNRGGPSLGRALRPMLR